MGLKKRIIEILGISKGISCISDNHIFENEDNSFVSDGKRGIIINNKSRPQKYALTKKQKKGRRLNKIGRATRKKNTFNAKRK